MAVSSDHETTERAGRGERPDCIGWPAIARALGVDVRTAMRWEGRFRLPLVRWGTFVAAYKSRLTAVLIANSSAETRAA